MPISLAIIALPTTTTLAGAMMFETNLAQRVNGILLLVWGHGSFCEGPHLAWSENETGTAGITSENSRGVASWKKVTLYVGSHAGILLYGQVLHFRTQS